MPAKPAIDPDYIARELGLIEGPTSHERVYGVSRGSDSSFVEVQPTTSLLTSRALRADLARPSYPQY
jgi:hypothetical protein